MPDLFRRYQVTLSQYLPSMRRRQRHMSTQPQRWGPSPISTPALPTIELK